MFDAHAEILNLLQDPPEQRFQNGSVDYAPLVASPTLVESARMA